MSKVRYSLFLALIISMTACGVRRDLTLPDRDRHSGHSNDVVPAGSSSTSPLD